jgi:membrane associated rhomboid family serine protease
MFVTFVEDTPASRKIPWANTLMIMLNVFVCWRTVGQPDFLETLGRWGFIPAGPFRHYGAGILTAPFLHTSWAQLIANMTFLFMFGKGVEERLGWRKYLAAYFLCSMAGQAVHWWFRPDSVLALVGASRAVSGLGVMYLLLYPWGRMKWIFSFFGVPFLEIPSRTAYVMLLWVVVQVGLAFLPWKEILLQVPLLSKLGASLFASKASAGIAWWAHLGALGMGFLLFLVFPRKKTE